MEAGVLFLGNWNWLSLLSSVKWKPASRDQKYILTKTKMLKTKKYYGEFNGYQVVMTREMDREVRKGWFSKIVTNKKINFNLKIYGQKQND